MKRNVALFSGFILTVLLTSVVTGRNGLESIKVNFRNIKINVNNKEEKTDLEPFVYNNSTYVPLRFVAEKLNTKVTWDDKTNTISIASDNKMKVRDENEGLDRIQVFLAGSYDYFRSVGSINIDGILYYKLEASKDGLKSIYVYYSTADGMLYNYENGVLSVFQ